MELILLLEHIVDNDTAETQVDKSTESSEQSDESVTGSNASASLLAATAVPDSTVTQVAASSTSLPGDTLVLPSYNFLVRVFGPDGNPIDGARVELHSDPLVTYSDENGYAYFENISPGEHKLLVSYGDYTGEQAVTAIGEDEKIQLEVKLEPNKKRSYQWLFMGAGSGIGLVLIVIGLIRKNKKRQ